MDITRLQSAFRKKGIAVSYANGVYHIQNDTSNADVLLPASLPLEEKAVLQLLNFASVGHTDSQHPVCKACATPDFHPGTTVPVGTVVATDGDFVIPQAIGTDINCGMRLLSTGVKQEYAATFKLDLIKRLQRVLLENERNLPLSPHAFRTLFDNGPADFLATLPRIGLWEQVDKDRLFDELKKCIGLDGFKSKACYAPEALLANRDIIRDPSLGTVGGGNHFIELQRIHKVFDRQSAYQFNLHEGDLVVMIHSGSRDVGFYVGQRWMDKAKEAWPAGVKHPAHKLYGLKGLLAAEYLYAMGAAARYAWLNRVTLAEMVRKELETVLGLHESKLIADIPHNVVMTENGLNIHRKGSTPAHKGNLVIIPGSMGDSSYIGLGLGNTEWLESCSHGAGRAIRRQDTHRNKETVVQDGSQSWECITLKEERRYEEAPSSYKPIGPVITAQEEAGLISKVAELRPWITFKA
jgi:tRNA-splicing ligase RtcB